MFHSWCENIGLGEGKEGKGTGNSLKNMYGSKGKGYNWERWKETEICPLGNDSDDV